jgi:hypothetical protein
MSASEMPKEMDTPVQKTIEDIQKELKDLKLDMEQNLAQAMGVFQKVAEIHDAAIIDQGKEEMKGGQSLFTHPTSTDTDKDFLSYLPQTLEIEKKEYACKWQLVVKLADGYNFAAIFCNWVKQDKKTEVCKMVCAAMENTWAEAFEKVYNLLADAYPKEREQYQEDERRIADMAKMQHWGLLGLVPPPLSISKRD